MIVTKSGEEEAGKTKFRKKGDKLCDMECEARGSETKRVEEINATESRAECRRKE